MCLLPGPQCTAPRYPHQSPGGPFLPRKNPQWQIIITRVHRPPFAQCCAVCGFRHTCSDMYTSLQRHTGSVPAWSPPCSNQSPSPHPGNHKTCLLALPFPGCHRVGITQCVAFSDWPLSFNNMHSISPHLFMSSELISFQCCTISH